MRQYASGEGGLGDVLDHCHNAETQLGRKVNPNCYILAEFNKRRQETDSFVQRVLAQPVIVLFGELHAHHSTREPRENRTVKSRKT